jgi:hypothetical protein
MLDAAASFYNCSYNDIKNNIERDRIGNEIGVRFINEFKGREIKTATGGFRKKINSLGPDSFHQFEWNKPNGEKVTVTIKDYLQHTYNIDIKCV